MGQTDRHSKFSTFFNMGKPFFLQSSVVGT